MFTNAKLALCVAQCFRSSDGAQHPTTRETQTIVP